MSRTASTIEAESIRIAPPSGGGRRRAVVRLRGSAALAPETLLDVAERVRRALRIVGVTDVSIQIESDGADVD